MNSYNQLYILVEGPQDERFFEKIIKPLLQKKYDYVKIIKYAGLTKKTIKKYIEVFGKQKSSEYLFVSDFDARGNTALCISLKKNKIIKKYDNVLRFDRIFIVKEEIESWYLAGITKNNLKKYQIKEVKNTEIIDKETFYSLVPKQFQNKTDFMIEIIKHFDLNEGISKNKSLRYFFNKLQNL